MTGHRIPSLAKLPPDDVTDPPPLFTFEQYPPSVNDNVVLQWDEELLQAVRALPPGPMVTARAISLLASLHVVPGYCRLAIA